MKSCLYEGRVRHRRLEPVRHEFGYGLALLYLDLAELEQVFSLSRWWGLERAAPACFRRRDYLGDPARPLAEAVRDRVQAELGRRPRGPVRLLTHPRYLGYVFNPVSFYFCFDAADAKLEAVVAEVTNVPWKERHAYVLDARSAAQDGGRRLRFRTSKAFHVSPFLDMDFEYAWSFSGPGEVLRVDIANLRRGRAHFAASLALERRELSARALRGALLRYPLMTARVVAAIYWQALRLRLRRVPFHPHPGAGSRSGSTLRWQLRGGPS